MQTYLTKVLPKKVEVTTIACLAGSTILIGGVGQPCSGLTLVLEEARRYPKENFLEAEINVSNSDHKCECLESASQTFGVHIWIAGENSTALNHL